MRARGRRGALNAAAVASGGNCDPHISQAAVGVDIIHMK